MKVYQSYLFCSFQMTFSYEILIVISQVSATHAELLCKDSNIQFEIKNSAPPRELSDTGHLSVREPKRRHASMRSRPVDRCVFIER